MIVKVFTNHMLAENIFHELYRVKKHKIIILNPANKCEIVR